MGTVGDKFDMVYGWIGGRWVQVDVDGVPVLRERSSRCSEVDLLRGLDQIIYCGRGLCRASALTSGLAEAARVA